MEVLCVIFLTRTVTPTREILSFSLGVALWIAVFHGLLRPFRAYVLAHEMSHALWGFLSGAAVSDLRVSQRGGSVRLSEAGLFTTLAPYFFPIYTLLLLALYGVFSLFFDPAPWGIPWMAALGASWGFHITFTISVTLDSPQPDLREYGFFFSTLLIVAMNLAILLFALVLLGSTSWSHLIDAAHSAFSLFVSTARAIILRLTQIY